MPHHKFLQSTILALTLFSTLSAEPWYAEPATDNLYVGVGYRRDDFKYSFQGPEGLIDVDGVPVLLDGFPNVLADFRWKEIQSAQVNAEYNHTTLNQWYWRFNGMYGTILSGKTTHNEYAADDKELKFSTTHADADKGEVWDVSAGFGHLWVSDTGRFSFAPLAGYSFHEQRYHISNGDQVFNPLEGVLGDIPELKGRNYAQWSSPWLGLDMLVRLQSNVILKAGGEWHFVRYQSSGYWRTGDTFDVHWRDKAFGYGSTAYFGFDCDLCEGWSLGLCGNYRHFYTRQGHHRTSVKLNTVPDQIFGTIPTVDNVKLNRVTWNTYSVSCNIAYRF